MKRVLLAFQRLNGKSCFHNGIAEKLRFIWILSSSTLHYAVAKTFWMMNLNRERIDNAAAAEEWKIKKHIVDILISNQIPSAFSVSLFLLASFWNRNDMNSFLCLSSSPLFIGFGLKRASGLSGWLRKGISSFIKLFLPSIFQTIPKIVLLDFSL